MSERNFDVEAFINEVKKFQELWDINCDEYRFNKKRKQRSWAEVARVFVKKFDELPEREKQDIYKKLHEKWRNIRDSYVRSKRNTSRKKYVYAQHLTFLHEVYKPNSSQSESEETWNEEAPKVKVELKRARSNSNSDDSNSGDKRKRIIPPEIEYLDTTFQNSNSFPVEDEDRSFFDSLLPAVREFNLDQKLEFRSQVISLVKKIRAVGQYAVNCDFPSL